MPALRRLVGLGPVTREAAAVLFHYERLGFTFKRRGPFLQYGPVSKLTPDDHALLKRHVDDILPMVDAYTRAEKDRKHVH